MLDLADGYGLHRSEFDAILLATGLSAQFEANVRIIQQPLSTAPRRRVVDIDEGTEA